MNRKTLEYLGIALCIGLGTPIFTVWGMRDGEKLALMAYPPSQPVAVAPQMDLKSVFLATDANIAKGQALFQANCISCHGEKADGQGAAAKALTPPPRNFLDPAAKWTRSRDPAEIFQSISQGSPGTAMVGFSAMLKPEDRWAIVHFLGSLPGSAGQYEAVAEARFDELKKASGL